MPITKPTVHAPWADGLGSPAVTVPVSGLYSGGYAGGDIPTHADHNYLFNRFDNALRYFSRHGLPDWDAAETYVLTDMVRGADGGVYVLAAASPAGTDPSIDRKHWARWNLTDAWGFQLTRHIDVRQDFESSEAVSELSPVFETLRPGIWLMETEGDLGGGKIELVTNRTISPMQRFAKLTSPIGLSNSRTALTVFDALDDFKADNVIKLEWDTALPSVGANGVDVRMGIGNTLAFASASDWFAHILKRSSDTNWFAQTRDGTNASGFVDLGVAPTSNVAQHFAVEHVGANRSPTGAAQCRFYIDGVLKTTITTNQPSAATNPECRPVWNIQNQSSAVVAIYVGSARFRANTWAADAAA